MVFRDDLRLVIRLSVSDEEINEQLEVHFPLNGFSHQEDSLNEIYAKTNEATACPPFLLLFMIWKNYRQFSDLGYGNTGVLKQMSTLFLP